MAEHVLTIKAGDVTAAIRLGDDLTVVDVQTSTVANSTDASNLLQTGVVPGRSRVGRLQALNCNTFPPQPLPGLRAPVYTGEFHPEDDVTVALAEGPGVALATCSPLNALTCWWLTNTEGQEPSPEDVAFEFAGGIYRTTSSLMRSFISATAPDFASPVIHVAAIPRTLLPSEGTKLRVTSSSVDIHAELEAMPTKVRRVRIDRAPATAMLERRAILELPWQSRTLPGQTMAFCVNNHPKPFHSPDGEIADHVRLAIPRSGRVNADLLADGYAAGTSPTIQCATFYWLGERADFADSVAAVDGMRVPSSFGSQPIFESLTDVEPSGWAVHSVQVPLADIATAVSRQDLFAEQAEFVLN